MDLAPAADTSCFLWVKDIGPTWWVGNVAAYEVLSASTNESRSCLIFRDSEIFCRVDTSSRVVMTVTTP